MLKKIVISAIDTIIHFCIHLKINVYSRNKTYLTIKHLTRQTLITYRQQQVACFDTTAFYILIFVWEQLDIWKTYFARGLQWRIQDMTLGGGVDFVNGGGGAGVENYWNGWMLKLKPVFWPYYCRNYRNYV